MSSPTDRTYDPSDPSPYAPRWVRDAAHGPRRISAAGAGRHRLGEDDDTAPATRGREHAAPPLAAGEPSPDEQELVIDNFRVPRSLDPGTVPDPWPALRPRPRSGALGMFGRLAFAVAIAAVGALVAVGKLSLPGAGASGDPDPVPPFGARFAAPAPKAQDRPAVTERSEPQQVAMAQPAASAPAAMPGITVVSAAPAAALPPAAPAAPAPPAIVAPAADPRPAASALDPESEEVASLIKRGEQLASAGDIAAARLMLRRAAEARNARAALALAATYDPIVLEKIGIYGISPDVATARLWYEKAREFGSAEAPRRLELLASRSR